jgi:uncharacterized protein YjbI with pentapeptide repeats
MNRPEVRIPEDRAQEVFALAAQLYAQHEQSYSAQELMEAGTEAKIPPEFIQQALDRLQLQQVQPSGLVAPNQRFKSLLGLGLVALASLIAAGVAFSTLNAKSPQSESEKVNTTESIPNQPQVSDANLGGSNFKCGNRNLASTNLRGRNLNNADCTRANLAEANLSQSTLESANLSYANLAGANLTDADLAGADLAGADLAGADLTGANLEGANLNQAQLEDAIFGNANLEGVDFAGANLEGVDLTSANTDGASFTGVRGNYRR